MFRIKWLLLMVAVILSMDNLVYAAKKKSSKVRVKFDVSGEVDEVAAIALSNAEKRIAQLRPIKFDIIDLNDHPPLEGILFSW